MGCCTSRKSGNLPAAQELNLNTLHPSLDSADRTSKETGRHTIRITLKELHLTKNTERVTKEACSLSIRFRINDIICESRIIENPSLHIAWTEELKATLGREDDSAEIQLLAHQGIDVTELGFATFDLEPLLKLKKFGGSVQLSYRCTKSATLVCEVSLVQGVALESNYITLGSSTQSSVLHLLPVKEYPIPYNSRLRTPQFTSRSFATSSSADHVQEHDSRALIARIKDQKTSIDELLEVLNDERPEVIYYACLRLQFFASQTNYSKLMLDRSWLRLTELMTLMCRDQWVSLQLLWIVFRLLDHMPEVRNRQNQRLEEAGAIAVAAVLKVWKELLTTEVTSLAIEVTVRLVPDGAQKSRLNSLCQNFNLITLLFDTLSKYKSTQIVSPVLILICEILDIPNKYEYVSLTSVGTLTSLRDNFLPDDFLHSAQSQQRSDDHKYKNSPKSICDRIFPGEGKYRKKSHYK